VSLGFPLISCQREGILGGWRAILFLTTKKSHGGREEPVTMRVVNGINSIRRNRTMTKKEKQGGVLINFLFYLFCTPEAELRSSGDIVLWRRREDDDPKSVKPVSPGFPEGAILVRKPAQVRLVCPKKSARAERREEQMKQQSRAQYASKTPCGR
jgi:hypothetical protein